MYSYLGCFCWETKALCSHLCDTLCPFMLRPGTFLTLSSLPALLWLSLLTLSLHSQHFTLATTFQPESPTSSTFVDPALALLLIPLSFP